MKCPNCGNEMPSDWKVCGYCGNPVQNQPFFDSTTQPSPANQAPSSHFAGESPSARADTTPSSPSGYTVPVQRSTPPPTYTPPPPNNYAGYSNPTGSGMDQKKIIGYIIGGIVFVGVVILLISLIVKNTSHPASQSSDNSGSQSSSSYSEPTNDINNFVPVLPTDTPEIIPTAKLKPTKTPGVRLTCPGAKEQRVEIDEKARVCTHKDRLILREDPKKDGDEIVRIYPETEVKIIDGPRCDDNSSWWLVEVPRGTNVFFTHQNKDGMLSSAVQGWVREGSDDKDPYYLCPEN